MSNTAPVLRGPNAGVRGSIAVAALWLLAALAALASTASAYVAQSAIAFSALDATTQFEMLTTAGVELAAFDLLAPRQLRRPTRASFDFTLASARVTVEYVSESARVNLNTASRTTFAGLFASLGAPADAADQFADRVVAWRSRSRPGGADGEQDLYRAAGLTYLPRQGPFASVEELSLVVGLPQALVERALPFLTVYSGLAGINVLDAPPEVVAALPGMTPARLEAFLGQRDSLPRDDPEFVLGALGGRVAGATVEGSDAYRVRVRVILPGGRQRMSEGIIALAEPGEKGAYQVYTWRDDIDPATGAPQR
jgi:general secretion pathway protein K